VRNDFKICHQFSNYAKSDPIKTSKWSKSGRNKREASVKKDIPNKRIDECQEGYPCRNQRLLNLKTRAHGQNKKNNKHDLGNSYEIKRSGKCQFPSYATKEEGYPQQEGIIPST